MSKPRDRNKNLKTLKQLSEYEKGIIIKEFNGIYDLFSMIKEDKYNQLRENDFKYMIESSNRSLDMISEKEEGFYAKYLILTEKYIELKVKGKHIYKSYF